MAIRDNAFLEKVKKNSPTIVAAAVAYVLALLIICGWLAGIADKDQSLIASKSITMEQIKAMSSMGYWMGRAWFWSLLAAAVLIYFLIKAAGKKKASTGKAIFLTVSSVVIVVCLRGWVVVSKAAFFKFLLGNWLNLIPLAIIVWLAWKFRSKLKRFFAPKEEQQTEPVKEDRNSDS